MTGSQFSKAFNRTLVHSNMVFRFNSKDTFILPSQFLSATHWISSFVAFAKAPNFPKEEHPTNTGKMINWDPEVINW